MPKGSKYKQKLQAREIHESTTSPSPRVQKFLNLVGGNEGAQEYISGLPEPVQDRALYHLLWRRNE